MNHQNNRRRFGQQLQLARAAKKLTQEQLAETLRKSTEHISFLERGERSPSFETLFALSEVLGVPISKLLEQEYQGNPGVVALDVAPPALPLPEPAKPTLEATIQQASDLELLDRGINGIREMQRLADRYGIYDILQDNGGKVLQVLILLGLRISPGREGNDAVDEDGNEYELKTVNRALNHNAGITTHHHLNRDILEKYRSVKAWYVAIYEAIELKEIYRVLPAELEPLFTVWENKVASTGKELNNPKIPIRLVRLGERVYPK